MTFNLNFDQSIHTKIFEKNAIKMPLKPKKERGGVGAIKLEAEI